MNQSTANEDFFVKADIQSSVRDIQELLKVGIFSIMKDISEYYRSRYLSIL